ncbi:MAG: Uroporphyrinogen decarboxylase [Anaerolineales bacterium]|nr:Uroporphyrinogen decarboxylase [Anaerolineales bacterium]
MTPRERFAAVTNHQEPDRVPIDWGRHVGSIHRNAYIKLKEHLGDPDLQNEDKILDRMVQNVYPDGRLLRKFGVDFRWLEPNWVDVEEVEGEDAYRDMWGITWRYMLNSYSLTDSPLSGATIGELDTFAWPDPHNPAMFAGLRERAQHLYENTDYVVVADSVKGGLLTKALQIRGYEDFFMDLAMDLEFAEALLDKLLALYKEMWTAYMQEVGPYVQMVYFTDDIGAQDNLLISPDMFRQLIKPRLTEMVEHLKGLGDVKVMYHTDGTVAPVMDDIVEMGVDILNPVQTSAMGMNTYVLKEKYGDRICFHGAIDVQQMLPSSTPAEVRYDVAKRIYDLGRGGGFILSTCHDVGEDVPPENVVAMFEAVQEYGQYPLQLDDVLKEEDLNPAVAETPAEPAPSEKRPRPRRT